MLETLFFADEVRDPHEEIGNLPGRARMSQEELRMAMHGAIGLGWVLIIFAALCMVAITFIALFLPETKGHSVEEITRMFEASPSS